MDKFLLELISLNTWQWINLVSSTLGGFCCAWLCFWRLDPDNAKYNRPVKLLGHFVQMTHIVLLMRASISLLTCALGTVAIASIEVLSGYATGHMPTEVLVNTLFALSMVGVILFHVALKGRQ